MKSVDLLIIHANELITVAHDGPATGAAMGDLKIIPDGAVAVIDERIVATGTTDALLAEYRSDAVIDATGKAVSPGLVDCHTHAVFIGSREDEFEKRLTGKSYLEILQEGGGIGRTTASVRAASKEELYETSREHLNTMLAHGTTTAEVKSGYGLNTRDELRMLEVIRDLNRDLPIDLIPTFLGAHALPKEYKNRHAEFVALVWDQMIPEVAMHGLAEFCDIFCEKGVFTVEESRDILTVAKQCGMKLKLHADELCRTGGAALAAELGAVSADHLAFINDDDIHAMAAAGVVAVLLPGTAYSLGDSEHAPARKLIEAGTPVAIATDLNPGSSMTESLQIVVSLACVRYGLTPAEGFTAVTLNAACAVSRGDTIGSLQPDRLADIVIWNMPSYRSMPYHFGINLCDTVVKRGRVAWRKENVTNH